MRHVGRDEDVQYVVQWNGYTPGDKTLELPEHIPDHFITGYWCQIKKCEAVRQRTGWSHTNINWKLQQLLTLTDDSFVGD